MEIVKNVLVGIYLVICVILIVLVLSQSKEDGGASGTIVGASANNFYEKNKGRTNGTLLYFNNSIRSCLYSINLGKIYIDKYKLFVL